MNRLKHGGVHPGGINVPGGGQPNAAGNRTGQVRENIAKQVIGHDHVIPRRVGHHIDGGGINMVIVHGNIRVFLSHLVDSALPQAAGMH